MSSASVVANRFLDMARQGGRNLTPMQLLKLVYLAHGWMLGLNGEPLISERIEAWTYGPVIPALYDHLRNYRGAPVTHTLPGGDTLTEQEDRIVRQTYDIYVKMTSSTLSNITHAHGSPWAQVWHGPESFGDGIPNDIIQAYYAGKASQASAA